jgi:polyhydroxyalkanoate synthesis regulator phasin
MKKMKHLDGSALEAIRAIWNSLGQALSVSFLSLLIAVNLAASPFLFATPPAREPQLGPGFTKEFTATMQDVLQALHEILEDQTIHGTLIFDKQPVLTGAIVVGSTPLFEPYEGTGKVFYKVRNDAIAPRHFLDSADQGTIAIRYIVTAMNEERIRLHIDATYVEKTHRKVHISDGTVEASEGKAIEDRLLAIQSDEQEAYEANRRRASADLVRQTQLRQREDETTRLSAAQSSVQNLEQQVRALRHEVERRIKAPGADVKAAPFRSSATVANLRAYTEVLMVIVTPHWIGIESPDGQRGWLLEEELEPLP